MTPDRWISALEQNALSLSPLSAVLIYGASGDMQLDVFGQARLLAVQGFYPDHARVVARGIEVHPDLPDDAVDAFDLALVAAHKSKKLTLSRIAKSLMALRKGGILMVDGAKTIGIESILKALKSTFDGVEVFSKSHGKLIWFARPDVLPQTCAEWVGSATKTEDGHIVPIGSFSADGPDQGSEILIALAPKLKGRVADLGAGWGYIAAHILDEQDSIETLDLIEADHAALEAARQNVGDLRARFFWADATAFKPDALYDAILCNPPFHTSRAADPALGQAFISAASRLLKPSGQFLMVANRHLPYESALKANFSTGRMLAEMQGYKLYQAGKPKAARSAR